jgi:hypothetical protein
LLSVGHTIFVEPNAKDVVFSHGFLAAPGFLEGRTQKKQMVMKHGGFLWFPMVSYG